jgi:pantoate--beta-alanine ligase
MIIFKTADQLTGYLDKKKKAGVPIGFVPTMGALHNGHLSLIDQSREQNALTVCSIFVNPTQFNNKEDFTLYPISIEKDIEQLIHAGCDVLFLPSEKEIYPENYQPRHYDLGKLEHILEGHHRPGHFQGVCQVVDRLLAIVNPHNIYIGQKDYQQCMVIRKLVDLLGKSADIHINIAPTIREGDGLAMSSRNLRLSEVQRTKAVVIYKELTAIKEATRKLPFDQIKKAAIEHLQEVGFSVDYVEIANAETLEPASGTQEPLVALIAASLDHIRLIDNLSLN